MMIAIDAGHGGQNKGAQVGDLWEKDLTLAVALDLYRSLQSIPTVEPFLIRAQDRDVSLGMRGRIAGGADVVISLHVNTSPDPNVKGLMIFHLRDNHKAAALAENVARYCPKDLKRSKIIYQTDPDGWTMRANAVLRPHGSKAAILIEMAHATNAHDLDLIRSGNLIPNVCPCIVGGIVAWMRGNKPAPMQPLG